MANTAPAHGACRRCRERGETRQLHGSRNTRTLMPAPEGRRRSALFLVRLLRRSALASVLTSGLWAVLPEKLLSEATQGDSAPHANPAKALFVGFHSNNKLSIPRLGLVQLVRIPHCHGQFPHLL